MNIFITGGTTGIGLELALYYHRQGHTVGICGRSLSKLPDNFPQEVHTYEADVRQGSDLKNAFSDFKNKTADKKIDIVIANAGVGISNKKSFPDIQMAKTIIDINVIGFLNTVDAAIEMMKSSGGHFVAIGSVAGRAGLPKTSAYSASKAFINTFMESLAIDLPSHGIHITNILPGFVDTPLTQKNNHPMPFLMPSAKAAQKIAMAIHKKKNIYAFPWQMKSIITLLYYMPRTVYIFLMIQLGHIFYGKKK